MDHPPIDPDDLVCVRAIAERCSISEEVARQWVEVPTFPDPLVRLAIGRVWYWPDIDIWVGAWIGDGHAEKVEVDD